MSYSSDPRTLFQSGAAQALGERRAQRAQQLEAFTAQAGWPISLAGIGVPKGHNPSGSSTPHTLDPARGAALDGGRFKALSIASAPRDVVAVAEASGIVRAVHAGTGASLATYPASTGPVFAVLPLVSGRALMVASGWDKALRFFALDPPMDEAFAPPPRSDALAPTPPVPQAPVAKVALVRPILVVPDASADLVKALAWDPTTKAVIVSGSDATVRVYDAAPLVAAMQAVDQKTWRVLAQPVSGPSVPPAEHTAATASLPVPAPAAALRLHSRPILTLLVAPTKARTRTRTRARIQRATFFAGDSMGRIAEYTLSRTDGETLQLRLRRELRGHETSVNALSIGVVAVEKPRVVVQSNAGSAAGGSGNDNDGNDDHDDDDDDDEVPIRMLWSASGDRTVRGWVLDALPPGVKTGPWGGHGAGADRLSKATLLQGTDAPLYASYVLPLPDAGRAVLMLPEHVGGVGGGSDGDGDGDRMTVVTAGADEDLRVWSVPAPGQLEAAPSDQWLRGARAAHWHEVTGLVLWAWGGVPYVVSAGLDGVVHRWRADDLLAPAPPAATDPAAPTELEPQAAADSGMTAEEEAELEALMADD